jgi:glycosyltransferase involved in cell wall biosynthesis
MNILIFSIDSPFDEYFIGGLGVSIKHLCENLPSVNFHIITKFPNKKHENIRQYSLSKAEDVETLLSGLKECNIDLIHVFDSFYAEVAVRFKNELKVPLILTFALSNYHRILDIADFFKYISPEFSRKILAEKHEIKKILDSEKKIIQSANKVVFVSNYYENLIMSTHIDEAGDVVTPSSVTIYNGIDFEYYGQKSEQNYEMPGNPFAKKVLYLGRLDMMKNISLLLETEIPDGIELIVAGGGNLDNDNNLSEVVTILKNNLRPNVHYIGFLKGDKKRWFLQNCDAVIIPSIHEPFGIVALEAVASKTLLLCSRASGMEEFILYDMCIYCGVIPITIKRAYNSLLNITDEERLKIINTAYDSLKNLTWKANSDKYLHEYELLANKTT